MPNPPPDDVELAAFFGCEPTLLDPDAPWIVNTLTFEAERGGLSLRFQISPSYSTLSVALSAGSKVVTEIEVASFNRLEILDDQGRQTLAAHFGGMEEQTLWLTFQPEPRLIVAI